jgi:transcriptional regulator with XRE-family HTH domain
VGSASVELSASHSKSYFARQLKVFLAAQIRALRGERTQTQFGDLIGKPQSVVARLERESYGKVSLQTLIDIAQQLDIALIVRFVNHSTFLEWTKDYSQEALAPQAYSSVAQAAMALPSQREARKEQARELPTAEGYESGHERALPELPHRKEQPALAAQL